MKMATYAGTGMLWESKCCRSPEGMETGVVGLQRGLKEMEIKMHFTVMLLLLCV